MKHAITPALAAALACLAAAPAAAETLQQGRLVDAAGNPVAGATVTAYAWPAGRGTIKPKPAAQTTSAPDGTWTLELADDAPYAALADRQGGWLDFLISAEGGEVAGDDVVSKFFGPPEASAASADGEPPASFDLVASRPIADPTTQARAATDCPNGAHYGKPSIKRIGGRVARTSVGELNNAFRDTKAVFAYRRGATTSITTAFNPAGHGWELRHANTVTKTTSAGGTLPRHGPYARLLQTNVLFGKYLKTTCGIRGVRFDKIIKADKWVGSFFENRRLHGTIRVCSGSETYPGGGYTFVRSSKSAFSWVRGASVYGIGLTSKTGFSTSASLSYRFGGRDGKRHALCGSDGSRVGLSATDAPRVFSGTRRDR